ncbi:phytoene/squalene synthase family protein [Rhodoferax sp. 4810]|uniref:Phytoene/squalene synthase family protein n=1 Tax=Thiospirillum jenense TaxID=1653858 RepID=A0A839HNE9_9GAMM|nr:phytoene/squalene synthase family protein [Thiospirillum jenense]MBB1075817.1 phytoene/squalene synthase family protein [Rhodoferax jenense]MBB1126892.1 phytoene/squalene synthase family protein [Thiospirillum jenense]
MPIPLLKRDPNFADAADLTACRKLLSTGSRSFYAASFFLPKRLREPATALYAFCRLADDAIDLEEHNQTAALERLRERLDRAYRGRPDNFAADRAFAGAIAQFGIARALPEALLEGFEWDADGRVYHELSDVYAYSARVAAAVGAMMAAIMGVRDANVLARACDLGTAMQISNICRDVGEDARNGRIYLPLNWLRDGGLDVEAWLARPVFNEVIADSVARLLAVASELYQRAESGIARLPVACRPGIYAARLLYDEIGQEVARRGYDSINQRAVVSGKRKMALLSRAVAVTPFPVNRAIAAPALSENQFLVDAIVATPVPTRARSAVNPSNRSVEQKVVWVLDLFQTLDERQRDYARAANPQLNVAYNG